MGICENLTVLDPEQVTTEFQETELYFDEARKQVSFEVVHKASLLFSLGDF